jgi:hypothetical protein
VLGISNNSKVLVLGVGLTSVRRKHCVSTGVSFFFLELPTNFKFEKRVFVETQCLRLTNAQSYHKTQKQRIT